MAGDEPPGEETQGGFLPPVPSGPEPDLSAGGPAEREAPADQGFLPPHGAVTQEYAAATPPAQWAQASRPAVPDNGDALAGVILSVSAATLLLLSVGLSSIISVVCAGVGIYYSRKGRARVDRGETPKHRGVAQAGFWIGVVTLILSVLMTIVWTAVAVLYATDDDFRQDLKDELDDDDGSPDGFETAIPVIVAVLRGAALLLR